jgi:tetratricopeptide (TPR) repeat protein
MRRRFFFGIAMALFLGSAVAVEAAVDPVVVEVHYQNGVKFFKRGLYDKSIQEFEKTLELDPGHAEAKSYLTQVKELQKSQRPAEAKASDDARIRGLYAEGQRLYRERRYEDAIKVFDEILTLKKIDDFASFYKEKCEGLLAQRLAKEQAVQNRVRRKEEAVRARALAVADRDQKRLLKVRVPEPVATPPVAAPVKARAAQAAKPTRAEKVAEAQARRDASRQAVEEKRAAAKLRRTEKVGEKQARREETVQEIEARRLNAAVVSDQKKEAKSAARYTKAEDKEERDRIKKLFLDGVRSYGRRDFQAAIRNLQDVVTAEKKAGVLYTHSAERLMEKARKRLAGEGRDQAI